MEDIDHVQSFEGAEAAGGQSDSGLVIEEVEDLDRAAVSELPGGGVKLPGFVGQLGLEADEGSSGSFVRLGGDEALALEDAPNGGDRWRFGNSLRQVVMDGLRDRRHSRRPPAGIGVRRSGLGSWSRPGGSTTWVVASAALRPRTRLPEIV